MAKWKKNNIHCRLCIFATDFHEKDYKGDFFLCKCKYSDRSRFLDNDGCENFQKKTKI